MHEALQWYIENSCHLIALRGKRPRNGWRSESLEQDEIMSMISRGYNIGWRLTERDVVMDIDPRNGGLMSLAELESELGIADWGTALVRTGGGGFHYYFQALSDMRLIKQHTDYPGIDMLSVGAQVVAAGATHPDTGEPYSWVRRLPAATLPVSVAGVYAARRDIVRSEDGVEQSASGKISAAQLAEILNQIPVAEYNTNDSWFNLMAAAAHATGGDGEDAFVCWSLGDPDYAGHEAIIRQRWKSIQSTAHGQSRGLGTLLRAAVGHGGCGLPELSTERAYGLLADNPISLGPSQPASGAAGGAPPRGGGLAGAQWDLPLRLAQKLLVERYDGGAHLCFDASGEFWEYREKYWVQIPRAVVERHIYCTFVDECKNIKKKTPTSTTLSQAASILRARTAEETIMGLPDILDLDVTKINCQNGTLHIDTWTGALELRPHDPGDRFVSALGVDYSAGASCPLWTQSLLEIFSRAEAPDIMVGFLQEIFGYTIQARKNIPAWFLLHGSGANGKSVVLHVLGALLGQAAVHRGLAEIAEDNHALAGMIGALAVIDDDLRTYTVLQDDFLKKLTENKMLTANPKYKPIVEFISTATVILASNQWPQSRDLSDGMRRRAHVLPFTRRFAESEMDLDRASKIVSSELPGVLAWALDGLARLRERGRFAVPAECIAARDNWILHANQVAVFADECYERILPSCAPHVYAADLWARYQHWCADSGIKRAYSKPGLIEALVSIGWERRSGRGPAQFTGVRPVDAVDY